MKDAGPVYITRRQIKFAIIAFAILVAWNYRGDIYDIANAAVAANHKLSLEDGNQTRKLSQ